MRFLLPLLLPFLAGAEIIPAGLRTTWQDRVGVSNGIPAVSTVFTTLAAGSTKDQINAALAACPSNAVVELGEGAFTIDVNSYGLAISKSGVVLRGQGSNTVLALTGGNGNGAFLVSGQVDRYPNFYQARVNGVFDGLISWTNGFTAGTSNLVVNTVSNLTVGQMVCLDQLNDTNIVTIMGWDGACTYCSRGSGARSQQQWVTVVGTNGNTVTVWPPLMMTNLQASLTPEIWWVGGIIERSGIENLTIDGSANGSWEGYNANLFFYGARDCWASNIWSLNANVAHVCVMNASRIELRHSWFQGAQSGGSMSYGILPMYASHGLLEDCVFLGTTAPLIFGSGASGWVAAYNYSPTNFYESPATYMTAFGWSHDAHVCMNLLEGNYGQGWYSDLFHGSASHIVNFRNRWLGWQTNKSANTWPIQVASSNYWLSAVGNVLGQTNYHTSYQNTDYFSIYQLGSGNGVSADDPLVIARLYRHGNYDTVTGLVWDAGNADHSIPDSLFHASKPAFYGTNTWPSIGPDLSPMVSAIPAMLRYQGQGTQPSEPPPDEPTATNSVSIRGSVAFRGGITIRGN